MSYKKMLVWSAAVLTSIAVSAQVSYAQTGIGTLDRALAKAGASGYNNGRYGPASARHGNPNWHWKKDRDDDGRWRRGHDGNDDDQGNRDWNRGRDNDWNRAWQHDNGKHKGWYKNGKWYNHGKKYHHPKGKKAYRGR